MKLATFSRGIKSIDILEKALGTQVVLAHSPAANDHYVSGYIGWGRKRSGQKAEKAATSDAKAVILLEDGFLGYWGHPTENNIRLSLNIDYQGIYYDARTPSQLENMLSDDISLTQRQIVRARDLINSIQINHLTKYNHDMPYVLPHEVCSKLDDFSEYCLLIDQTYGDQSIVCGMAQETDFRLMLEVALSDNPQSLIVIKTHPDVLKGKKKSAIGEIPSDDRIIVIADNVHPHVLIEQSSKVYVVTSQLGFEALILEKPVVCFGAPFYAGWGLTDDRGQKIQRRQNNISLERLVYDSLIQYPVYIHPDTQEASNPEAIIQWMLCQRRDTVLKHKQIVAIDFSYWKKKWLSSFLDDLTENLKFISLSKLNNYSSDIPILVWGVRRADIVRQRFPDRHVMTMEDGFIRSAGLGVDLNKPSSLVVDLTGIYYDSTRQSDLENMLNSKVLGSHQIDDAKRLIEKVNNLGTTKYNVGDELSGEIQSWFDEQKKLGKELILVPGQVETDASIEFGSPKFKSNLSLLEQVRIDFPNAVIIYKPHPDRLSKGAANHDGLGSDLSAADYIIADANIAKLYSLVDRVCVLTSLSGFEALIRKIPVSVYGLPFYAGWGLTTDHLKCKRRTARLSLEELVYTTLVKYPRYINWGTSKFCSIDAVINELSQQPTAKTGSNYFSRLTKKIRNVFS